MLKTTRTTDQILRDILSRDTYRVWISSFEIIFLGQDHERIVPFIPHLSEIRKKTSGCFFEREMGIRHRFVDFAIEVIEFHRDSIDCPCTLYPKDCFFNPKDEVKNENILITDTFLYESSSYVDFYITQCLKCGRKFKVIEREYHSPWWKWELYE